MSWILALNVGLALGIILLGIAVAAWKIDTVWLSLPDWLRVAIVIVAVCGPWTLYFVGALPEEVFEVVGGFVVTVALSIGLLLGLPVLAGRIVGDGAASFSESR